MSNNSIVSNVNEISVQSEEEIQMLPNAKTRQTKVSFKENRYVKSDAEKILLSSYFLGHSLKSIWVTRRSFCENVSQNCRQLFECRINLVSVVRIKVRCLLSKRVLMAVLENKQNHIL